MVEKQGRNNFTHSSTGGDCGFTDSNWIPQDLKPPASQCGNTCTKGFRSQSRDVTITVTTAVACGKRTEVG